MKQYFIKPCCINCGPCGTPKEVTKEDFDKASEKESSGGYTLDGDKETLEVIQSCTCYQDEPEDTEENIQAPQILKPRTVLVEGAPWPFPKRNSK